MALAVILGAFGAHSLKVSLDDYKLAIFKTGVQYHFFHALGILALVGMSGHIKPSSLKRIAIFISIGILLFSGSLYLLAIRDLIGLSSYKWLGPLTPIGGVFFIIGWILLVINAIRQNE